MLLLLPKKSAIRFFAQACLLACPGAFAAAADQPVSIPMQGGKQLLIGQDQQYMLEAAKKVMKHDLAGALPLYDQAIHGNPANIEAYIQRSVVKRELRDAEGSSADAAMALRLSDAAIAR